MGRADLNRVLIEAALAHAHVRVHFNQQCVGASLAQDRLRLRDAHGTVHEVALGVTVGTDGAGSALRAALAAQQLTQVREEWLDHDYKELTVPPARRRPGARAPRAAHLAARRLHADRAAQHRRSFTATLFLARAGFTALREPAAAAG